MRCSRCSAILPDQAEICPVCGAQRETREPEPVASVAAAPVEIPVPARSVEPAQLTGPDAPWATRTAQPIRKSRWRVLVIAAFAVVLVVGIAAWQALGLQYVSGKRSSQVVSSYLDSEGYTAPITTVCPNALITRGQIIECEMKNRSSGNSLGKAAVEIGTAGVATVKWVRGVERPPTPAPVAEPSASPSITTAMLARQFNKSARASLKSKRGHTSSVWSRLVPTRTPAEDPWVLATKGRSVYQRSWNGHRWQSERLITMKRVVFTRIRSIDVNKDGRPDFWLEGYADGSGYTSIYINRRTWAEQSIFKDASGRYGAYYEVEWRDGRVWVQGHPAKRIPATVRRPLVWDIS